MADNPISTSINSGVPSKAASLPVALDKPGELGSSAQVSNSKERRAVRRSAMREIAASSVSPSCKGCSRDQRVDLKTAYDIGAVTAPTHPQSSIGDHVCSLADISSWDGDRILATLKHRRDILHVKKATASVLSDSPSEYDRAGIHLDKNVTRESPLDPEAPLVPDILGTEGSTAKQRRAARRMAARVAAQEAAIEGPGTRPPPVKSSTAKERRAARRAAAREAAAAATKSEARSERATKGTVTVAQPAPVIPVTEISTAKERWAARCVAAREVAAGNAILEAPTTSASAEKGSTAKERRAARRLAAREAAAKAAAIPSITDTSMEEAIKNATNAIERRSLRREHERQKRVREACENLSGTDGPSEKRTKGGGDVARGKDKRRIPHIVFVGQLSFCTTAKDLEEHLRSRAEIQGDISVRLLTKEGSNPPRSRGMAFVEVGDDVLFTLPLKDGWE